MRHASNLLPIACLFALAQTITSAEPPPKADFASEFRKLSPRDQAAALPALFAEWDQTFKEADEGPKKWNIAQLIKEVGTPSVPHLIKRLQLGEYGSLSPTASYSLAILNHLGPRARAAAPRLIALLKTDGTIDAADRARIVDALHVIAPHDGGLVAELLPLLETARSQSSAADALANIGPPARAALPALRKRLASRDSSLAGSAARAILRIERNDAELITEATDACWRLLEATEVDDLELKFLASIVVEHPAAFEKEAVARLARGDASHQAKIIRTWSYVSGRPPAGMPQLVIDALQAHPDDQAIVVTSIHFLTSSQTHPQDVDFRLEKLLRVKDFHGTSRYLAWFLGKNGKSPRNLDEQPLQKLLRSKDSSEQRFAIQVLNAYAPATQAERLLLEISIKETEHDVQKEWASALGNNGSAKAVEPIVALYGASRDPLAPTGYLDGTLLGGSPWVTRSSCVYALGQLGGRGEQVAGHLARALADPNPFVQSSATNAMAGCGREAEPYAEQIRDLFLRRSNALRADEHLDWGLGSEIYKVMQLLQAWRRTTPIDKRHACEQACLRILRDPEVKWVETFLEYYELHADEAKLVAEVERILADGSRNARTRTLAAAALARLDNSHVAARTHLLSSARRVLRDAEEFSVCAHYHLASDMMSSNELDASDLMYLAHLSARDEEVRSLRRAALDSRHMAVRQIGPTLPRGAMGD